MFDLVKLSRATAPPADFVAQKCFERLFPYQKAAVAQSALRKHILLAHPPGAGKTPIALAMLYRVGVVLIVCPPTIAKQWAKRAEEWLDEDIQVLDTGAKVRAFRGDAMVIIPDSIIHNLSPVLRFEVLIIDEVHRMKSRDARRTRSLFGSKVAPGIAMRSDRVIALTGTPLQNSPVDLYPFLSVCAPTVAPSFTAYTNRYCPPVEMKLKGVYFPVKRYDLNLQNLDELATKLRETVMIRPSAADCLAQLPPLIEDEYVLDIPKSQDPCADDVSAEDLAEVWDGVFASPERQEGAASTRRQSGVVKAEHPKLIAWLQDLIESGERPLLWCWHQSVATTLAAKLNCGFIHGGVPAVVREAQIQQYQAGTLKALALTIGTAGTGLDGLQHSGSLCVFVERDYVPSNNEQAVARLQRVGQTRGVRSIVVRTTLVCDKAIEIILKRKTAMSETVLK